MSRCRPGIVALVLVSLSLSSACDDSSADGAADAGTPSPLACHRVIPGSVVASLGWDDSVVAVERLGGCAWTGEQGVVVVATEPGSYDAACAALEREKPASGYDPTFDLPGSDAVGCAHLQEGELGMSKLVLQTDQGEVVAIRVGARVPTPPSAVRAALAELSERASEVP